MHAIYSTDEARQGDTVTGRCVTMGTTHTGRVLKVVEPLPYSGESTPRLVIIDGDRAWDDPGREVIVEAADVIERAPDLVLTDRDGTTFHATNVWGERVDGWRARIETAGDLRYRRRFVAAFPRYSRTRWEDTVIAQQVRPWERVVNRPTAPWGDDRITVETELVLPSNTWCMECGHDVRPDHLGRTSPYAVSISPAATNRSHTVRNYTHQEAHELADRERAAGNGATVGIDGCG